MHSYIQSVTDIGPESWKVKCGVRHAAPITDGGTLIMRNGPASARHELQRTHSSHSPSIAPFAIDLEELEEPARNSDAFGEIRRTTSFDGGRTTTNVSFWSGLFAGLATIGVGVAIAVTAFTSDPAVSYGTVARSRHVVAHVGSSLAIDTVELAETKAAPKPKKKVVRARPADGAVEEPAAPAPELAVEVPETE